MADAVKSKKWLKGDKFSVIIRVETFDISIKPILNHFMKLRKNDFNIRFVTKWKKPNIFREVINEDHIIFITLNAGLW